MTIAMTIAMTTTISVVVTAALGGIGRIDD
jgi:hypothetical protein